MFRLLLCLALVLGLTACADGARQLRKPVEPLGDFKLGHAIVVAPNIVQGLPLLHISEPTRPY